MWGTLFYSAGIFTDNGISMLLSAVNIAGSLCEDSMYDPWNLLVPEKYGAVLDDLKKAYDVVVVRGKNAGDTSERLFGVASVESFVVGESRGQQGVRISNFVKSERWSICSSPFPPQKRPAPVIVLKVQQRGNG